MDVIENFEKEGAEFFPKPAWQKQQADPARPFSYGRKNFGLNGDMGELEYLLPQTDPLSIIQISKFISNDPANFR
ncbi:hypothetical protein Nepgr_004075 [Nepenthes gracilis]|uniref:Uncharacterized protein n=1 Tax=Nepenthes gracilis TaxID=150966 RepID=A0AAD3XEV2_NEPGR|nr:hypothetical protein Nepgr_004075 [Nepenthes gracilis]